MQTDVRMFRAQTIRLQGELRPHASEQTFWRRSRIIRPPVGKHTTTCTEVCWGSDMPSVEWCDERVQTSGCFEPKQWRWQRELRGHASEQTLGKRSPAKSDGLLESRDFAWVSDLPSVEWCDEHVHISGCLSPNNEVGRGNSTPCIRTDLGETLNRKNQMACWKATTTCSHLVWLSAESCDESVFQHAACCGGWCLDWRERFNDMLMMGTHPR